MKIFCPYCDKEHDVVIKQLDNNCLIKGEIINYKENAYFCDKTNEYFYDGKMDDENLLSARDEYRKKHNLLTSYEIKDIRNKYNLSQSDLALILGWGEITITRYETKEIQTDNYDNVLRKISNDPFILYNYFIVNMSNFSSKKQQKIMNKISSLISDKNQLNKLIENTLKIKYLPLKEEVIGHTSIELNKILAVIKELLNSNIRLYKTKVAKLLWYIDMKYYQIYNKSMTGLAYLHMTYGACPLGLDLLLDSKDIKINIQEEDDFIKYEITNVDTNYKLTDYEIDTINQVVEYFKDYSTKDIVEFMHKEKAYLKTQDNEFISYKYSSEINI